MVWVDGKDAEREIAVPKMSDDKQEPAHLCCTWGSEVRLKVPTGGEAMWFGQIPYHSGGFVTGRSVAGGGCKRKAGVRTYGLANIYWLGSEARLYMT